MARSQPLRSLTLPGGDDVVHNIVVFDPTTELAVAVLSNASKGACPYWDDTHTEDLDGVLTYGFTIPANHPDAAFVVNEAGILIHDMDGNPRLLKIKTVDDGLISDSADTKLNTTSGPRTTPTSSSRNGNAARGQVGQITKIVTCENAAVELIDAPVAPVSWNESVKLIANAILAGTRWQLGDCATSASVVLALTEHTNALDALTQLQAASGLDMVFRPVFSGSKVTGRYVDLISRRGAELDIVWEPSLNLKGVTRTLDSTGVITAAIGLGKADAKGNRLQFTSTVWTVAGGNPADKPAGKNYVGDPEALQVYGIPGSPRTHRYGYYDAPDVDNSARLLAGTWAYLQEHTQPAATYTVDPVLLENLGPDYAWQAVRLGDSLIIRELAFCPPLCTRIRVQSVSRSYASLTTDRTVS